MMTDQAIRFSEAIYKNCLRLFPEAHQREYGALMAQFFHDGLREVQRQNHPLKFVDLWIRMLTDVAINSVREHIYEWRQNLMETKNKFEFLTKYRIAELVCGIVAAALSFLAFRYGPVVFAITTASAVIIGTMLSTYLDQRWRKAA